MKKNLLTFLLVMVMLLSSLLVLASCGPDEPSGPVDGNDPTLDLNEGVGEGAGSPGLSVITDPSNPEAGAGTQDKYITD